MSTLIQYSISYAHWVQYLEAGLWKYHAQLVWPGHLIQDKLKISSCLSLDKYKCIRLVQMYKISIILYFIFWLIIMSSHVALKTL